jgi:putative ABC transport system permease protein
VQFSCSIALIISTVIIYRQIQYAKNRPIGYQVSRLMSTDANDDLAHNFGALKNDLLRTGAVTSVTTATSPATTVWSHTDLDMFQGKRPGETVEMGRIDVSSDYFKTLGMRMLQGRDFIPGLKADTNNVVFNEAAIKRLRLTNPVSQLITWSGQKFRIIGVVKDALMNSPYSAADPTMFTYNADVPDRILLYQLSPNINAHAAIEKISPIFSKYNPAYPYDYRFVDQQYNEKFSQEELIGKLAGVFAGLAIFISCLGLFGLAAFVAEQRTKEIGIRKVLGASVSQVWIMLSGDFILLVMLSCVIASPIAYYFLQKWLMKYDYHITIGPWVFIVSALAAILVTLITISFQSIKAALANPVKSLRSE